MIVRQILFALLFLFYKVYLLLKCAVYNLLLISCCGKVLTIVLTHVNAFQLGFPLLCVGCLAAWSNWKAVFLWPQL